MHQIRNENQFPKGAATISSTPDSESEAFNAQLFQFPSNDLIVPTFKKKKKNFTELQAHKEAQKNKKSKKTVASESRTPELGASPHRNLRKLNIGGKTTKKEKKQNSTCYSWTTESNPSTRRILNSESNSSGFPEKIRIIPKFSQKMPQEEEQRTRDKTEESGCWETGESRRRRTFFKDHQRSFSSRSYPVV